MSLNGIPIKTQTTPELIVEEVLQFILLIWIIIDGSYEPSI
jgi:hypothetical protein